MRQHVEQIATSGPFDGRLEAGFAKVGLARGQARVECEHDPREVNRKRHVFRRDARRRFAQVNRDLHRVGGGLPAFDADVSLKLLGLRFGLPGDDVQKVAVTIPQTQSNHGDEQDDQDNEDDGESLHGIALQECDEQATVFSE
jgi:hypothetical protein